MNKTLKLQRPPQDYAELSIHEANPNEFVLMGWFDTNPKSLPGGDVLGTYENRILARAATAEFIVLIKPARRLVGRETKWLDGM